MIPTETKTLIWDLDGTLIDSFGVFEEILIDTLTQFDLEMPDRETRLKNYHGSLKETVGNLFPGSSEDTIDRLLESFLQVQNSHYEVVEHHLFADAIGLVRRAHQAGLRQIIVSNRDHAGRLNASPRSIVERSSLKSMIDIVVAGDDSEHRKPKADVIAHLLEDGTVTPEHTIVIGDQFVDAEFANNLGAKAILVSRIMEKPEHMERLGKGWESYVTIVPSLDTVNM